MDTENSGIKAIPAVAPRFSVHYEGMPGCRFMIGETFITGRKACMGFW